ncbi:MAG: 23S rRNA (uracil(1939)-C(5))-methyltransferase RlmD [Oscillospiraceae bacterium]
MLKKNDIVELEIIDINHDCAGVAKYDGMAIFVPNTAIGDKIEAQILKVNKTYAYAKLNNIIMPSTTRTENDCPMYSKCGGCSLRHISYDEELRIKKNWIYENMKRIGGVELENLEIIPSEEICHYRNKAQYPVAMSNGEIISGFYANRSHRIIDCKSCKLQPDFFSDIIDEILDFAKKYEIPVYDEETGKGILRHIYIRYGKSTDEVMVCIVATKPKFHQMDKLIQKLRNLPHNIVSILINVNSENTNIILGDTTNILYGKDGITDVMCGITVDISSQSFYQVNKLAAEKLYNKAFDMANFNGNESVVELYCGVGTISLAMAHQVKKITAIEIVPEAIENAKENAQKNNITNVEFICDDALTTAKKMAENKEHCDIVLVDPPRKGCDLDVLEAMAKMSPEKIIYISCNSSTLARDCKILSSMGYNVDDACAVDLFPRTGHVETCVLLSHKNS